MDSNVINWEQLCEYKNEGVSYETTYRLKVPSGWLIKAVSEHFNNDNLKHLQIKMLFISDPGHSWENL